MNIPYLVPALCVAASSLMAADAALDSVTVTAPRESLTSSSVEQARTEASAVPGGTSVIAGDDIAKGRTSTLRDALATAPGVSIQPRFGSEESRLSIRGSGIQRTFHLRGVMLLQDGQPINQADGGADFQAIDPGTVEHITVKRGGNALEDGSSTLGGAIDFVTPTGYTAPTARLRAEGGSFGYMKALAQGGTVWQDFDGAVNASAYRQHGYRAHSEQKNARTSGTLGWRANHDVENRLWVGYSRSDSELPGTLTRAQYDSDPTQAGTGAELRDIKRDYPLLRIADRLAWDNGSEKASLGAGVQRKNLFHPLTFGRIEQDSTDWTGTLRLGSERTFAGHRNRLVAGANAVYGETDARIFIYTSPSGHDGGMLVSDAAQVAKQYDVFVEDSYEVVRDWWAVAGVQAVSAHRFQDDRFLANGDQSGNTVWRTANPKVGVLHDLTATAQAYANLSRSFEPPTFAEYVATDTSGTTRPQTNMEAQSAWTAELGTRGAMEIMSWDVSVYYAWVRNELLSYQVAPGLNQTVNANRTRHAGVELGHSVELVENALVNQDRIVLDNTWTTGWFHFDDDVVYDNNQLPGLPAHAWRGELHWERKGWYAGPVLEWQSAIPVDFANTTEAEPALLVGARSGYRSEHGFSAFIEGKNLADRSYIATTTIANPSAAATNQALYYPGDRLTVVAGVEWTY